MCEVAMDVHSKLLSDPLAVLEILWLEDQIGPPTLN